MASLFSVANSVFPASLPKSHLRAGDMSDHVRVTVRNSVDSPRLPKEIGNIFKTGHSNRADFFSL